jgi:hypothetical protein
MSRKVQFTALAAALAMILAMAVGKPVRAQMLVFDPSNYSQNLLTAARSLQQIQNQIKSLQNQAQMLINQAKQLEQLPTTVLNDVERDYSQIQNLLKQANGHERRDNKTRPKMFATAPNFHFGENVAAAYVAGKDGEYACDRKAKRGRKHLLIGRIASKNRCGRNHQHHPHNRTGKNAATHGEPQYIPRFRISIDLCQNVADQIDHREGIDRDGNGNTAKAHQPRTCKIRDQLYPSGEDRLVFGARSGKHVALNYGLRSLSRCELRFCAVASGVAIGLRTKGRGLLRRR